MWKISILSLIIMAKCLCFEKFINYGVDQEGTQLYRFFRDIHNGFYVDIGCYDPIFASNTLNLQAMGWQGINIDANPSRLARFFYSRPWEASLNFAIGDENQYVTLYELAEDSSSTLSIKVVEMVKNYKPVMDEISVPSISMKALCERFFYRRPIFLNLDIEGYGSKALLSNDWKNPKCRPEIIFSQINDETKESGLPLPSKVLLQQGYKKWTGTVGLNQIFITSELYDHYDRKYNESKKLTSTLSILDMSFIAYNFVANTLKLTSIVVPHYDPKLQPVWYHFAKYRQPVDLFHINEYSNQVSKNKKDRPIILLNYNPNDSYIVLRDDRYSASEIILQQIKFYNITITKEDGSHFSTYVLDHSRNNTARPKIVVSNMSKARPPDMTPTPIKPTINDLIREIANISGNSTTDTKLLGQIAALLNESISATNKTKQNIQFRSRELMTTILTNHYYDKSQFETVLRAISSLQSIFNSTLVQNEESTASEMQELKQELANAMTYQVFVLFAIFFAMLIINVVVCVAGDTRDAGKKTRVPRKLRKSQDGRDRRGRDDTQNQQTNQDYQYQHEKAEQHGSEQQQQQKEKRKQQA